MFVPFRMWLLTIPTAFVLATSARAQGPAPGQSCPAGGCPTGGLQLTSHATGPCRGSWCPHHHCPPPYRHCQEGPPRLRLKRGCPQPVCPPTCDTPNWGYYQPCWNPWPWPPDWSHCPVPPPAAMVYPGHVVAQPLVPGPGPMVLPPPRKEKGL